MVRYDGWHQSHIQETVGAMIVSEMIVQLAEFARGRLTLRGKTKVVQAGDSSSDVSHRCKLGMPKASIRYTAIETCELWIALIPFWHESSAFLGT